MCNETPPRYTSMLLRTRYPLGMEQDARLDETDAHLARQVLARAAGSGAAEAELYRRFAPRVRLYGLRHLRSGEGAADLAQQVMLTVIEQLRAGNIRQPEKIASFVLGTARLIATNLRRGEARKEELLRRFKDDVPFSTASLVPRLDEEKVAQCLEALCERERLILLMTFFEEASAERVGAALGLSAGNVRVVRHRGLEHLRSCLMGQGRGGHE
jgi:RNA polymerase sigma-70 factor, ECF subfamily